MSAELRRDSGFFSSDKSGARVINCWIELWLFVPSQPLLCFVEADLFTVFPTFNIPLLICDVVLRRKDKKVGLAGVCRTQKMTAGTDVFHSLENLVQIIESTALTKMVESIELFKINDGLCIAHPESPFHHAAGHGDPLCAG